MSWSNGDLLTPDNLNNKSGVVFNVKDAAFGAKGDGATDDSAAFTDAISAAGAVNGYVLVPPTVSSYQVGLLTWASGCRGIIGYGNPIIQQRAAGARILDVTGQDDITLQGFTLKGVAGGTEVSANQLALFTNCTNLTIHRVTFRNGWHRPLYLVGVVGFDVEACHFVSCSNGPYFTGCQDGTISRNRVKDSQQADGTFKVGIALQTYDATYGLNTNVSVTGNVVTGLKNGQGYLAHGGADLSFVGNHSRDTSNGMTFSAASANDTQSDLVVVGNRLKGVGEVAYTPTFDVGISFNGTQAAFTRAVVVGNAISNFNKDLASADNGAITCLGANDITITSNDLYDCFGNGVAFSGADSLRVLVAHNAIRSLTDDTGGTGGVKVDSPTVVSGKFGPNNITDCLRAYRIETASLTSLEIESLTEADNDGGSTGLVNTRAFTGITLEGSTTWNPGDIASGSGETSADITVTGVVFGDYVQVVAPYDLQGLQATAYVSAADTVKIRLDNNTGGNINLASGTWEVRVRR